MPDDVPCFSSYFGYFLKGGNEGFSICPHKIYQIFQLRKVELGNILYFSVIEFCFDTCLSKFVSRVPSCVPISRFFLYYTSIALFLKDLCFWLKKKLSQLISCATETTQNNMFLKFSVNIFMSFCAIQIVSVCVFFRPNIN